MRFNQGTKQMLNDEQITGSKPHVEAGAMTFAEREADAKHGIEASKELCVVFDAIRDLGIISRHECHALKLEARALFKSHEAAIWAFHNKLVRRCVDLGIDVPPPADPDLVQPLDGGGHR